MNSVLPHPRRHLQALLHEGVELRGRQLARQRADLELARERRIDRIGQRGDAVVVERLHLGVPLDCRERAHQHQPRHPRRVIDRQPLRDAGSHRVADDDRRRQLHRVHERAHVLGHVRVAVAARRPAGVAVPARVMREARGSLGGSCGSTCSNDRHESVTPCRKITGTPDCAAVLGVLQRDAGRQCDRTAPWTPPAIRRSRAPRPRCGSSQHPRRRQRDVGPRPRLLEPRPHALRLRRRCPAPRGSATDRTATSRSRGTRSRSSR